MMIDDRLYLLLALALALLGGAVAFVAWAFRVVPGWSVLAGAIGLPAAVFALLFLLIFASWWRHRSV